MNPNSPEKPPVLQYLKESLVRAETLLSKPEIPAGLILMLSGRIRSLLEEIYGKDSPLLSNFPTRPYELKSIREPRSELTRRTEQLRKAIDALEKLPATIEAPFRGEKIFIGHGRSHVWFQLKDFLRDRLGLACDEFNLEPAAGISTTARLEAMLAEAGFAFVIMTAEEEHVDGKVYARPNVIHESGLFQGKLGTRKAIVLLEEGCSDFSNISGLTQIRFPHDDLRPALEEIRRVLEREGLA